MKACIAAVALVRAEPAHACTSTYAIGSAGFESPFPTTGMTVPRNTKIWVPPLDYRYPDVVETDVVIKAGDVTIPTTVSRILVAGEADEDVLVFTPTTPLASGAAITVTVQGELMSQFTVGADEMLSAPPSP
ncbi:MAG TPA: hypothetical protein VIV11_00630, partial [Kofleriaceae bacterium]